MGGPRIKTGRPVLEAKDMSDLHWLSNQVGWPRGPASRQTGREQEPM
jgi:hypothetical protein